MGQFALAVVLTLVANVAIAKVPSTRINIPSAARHGDTAPLELDTLLRQVVDAVKQTGFTNVGLLPMFVISATDANGKRVMLLVDPQTMQAIEVKDEEETASRRN